MGFAVTAVVTPASDAAGVCYTEKAPNAWQRQGTQKARNTYNQPNRPNQQNSQNKHQALPAGVWHVPACMGNTSSGCDVANNAVSGFNTGENASSMSASVIGMAGMLAATTPCEWVAGRCTSRMMMSVGASCVGTMSDRTSPVSD